MVVDNRGILPASYSISSVFDMRASAGVIDIVVPCRWSDSPLVRRPIGIGPKTHWSEDSLVRKSAIGIGPKTIALVRKSVSLAQKPFGPKKCHWSENIGNVDYHVVLKPDTFIRGKLAF